MRVKNHVGDQDVEQALASPLLVDRWHSAERIARRGAEGILVAESLLKSDEVAEQMLGVQILGRVDVRDQRLCSIASGILTSVLGAGDPEIKSEAALSLARLPNVALVLKLMALRYTSSGGVRLAVALALDTTSRDAVAALIALSEDPDDEVRTWATFRLAQSDDDSAVLRAALRRRAADDAMRDVRGEALLGLARLQDEAATELIEAELRKRPGGEWVAEAAEMLPKRSFVALLQAQLEALTAEERDAWEWTYRRAIERCVSAAD